MAGKDVPDIYSWYKFGSEASIMLIVPGFVGGIVMYLCLIKIQKPYVLQVSLLIILATFYACLLVTETSIEDARNAGWIMPYIQNGNCTHLLSVIVIMIFIFIYQCIAS